MAPGLFSVSPTWTTNSPIRLRYYLTSRLQPDQPRPVAGSLLSCFFQVRQVCISAAGANGSLASERPSCFFSHSSCLASPPPPLLPPPPRHTASADCGRQIPVARFPPSRQPFIFLGGRKSRPSRKAKGERAKNEKKKRKARHRKTRLWPEFLLVQLSAAALPPSSPSLPARVVVSWFGCSTAAPSLLYSFYLVPTEHAVAV